MNDADTTNKPIEAALLATFGSLDNLTLSYDGWKGSIGANSLSNIVNSNFYNSADKVLADVQVLTNAIKGVPGLEGMVGQKFNEYLSELAEKGYDTSDPQVIANAALLYAADRVVENVNQAPDENGKSFEDRFVESWKGDDSALLVNHESELGTFGGLAAAFARIDAIVTACACDDPVCAQNKACSHGKCVEIRDTLAPFMDPSSNEYIGKDINTPNDAINNFGPIAEALNLHFQGCSACEGYYHGYGASADSTNDAKAYLSLLGQVNTSENAILKDIGNADLYSGSTVNTLVDGYVAAANAMKALQDAGKLVDGTVVISVSMDANGNVTIIAYPMDLT